MSDPNARRRQLAAAVNWRGLAEFLGRPLDTEGEDESEDEREGEPQRDKHKSETRASQPEL